MVFIKSFFVKKYNDTLGLLQRINSRKNDVYWQTSGSTIGHPFHDVEMLLTFPHWTLVSPLGIKNLLWWMIFYIGGVTCSISTSSLVNFAFTSGSHVWGIFSAALAAFSFRILVLLPISISFRMSKI